MSVTRPTLIAPCAGRLRRRQVQPPLLGCFSSEPHAATNKEHTMASKGDEMK